MILRPASDDRFHVFLRGRIFCIVRATTYPEMSYISTFCLLAAAPPDDPEARVALPPPVALPDLGGAAPLGGVRVLARAAAEPVALPDLPLGAGGGEALGGGRGSVDGTSGAAGRTMS